MTTEAPVRALQVLVVEDNPIDESLLRLAFKQSSIPNSHMIVARDGEHAIALLQHHALEESPKPDFIVLDLNVPKRDGMEILQMIRSTRALASIPVAILSSSPEDVIQHKLTTAGVRADGHFTKPMQLDQFLALGEALKIWYSQRAPASRQAG